MRNRRGSWTLVEMVVVLAIVAVLALWLVPKYLGGAKTPEGKVVSSLHQKIYAKGYDQQARDHLQPGQDYGGEDVPRCQQRYESHPEDGTGVGDRNNCAQHDRILRPAARANQVGAH